MSRPILSVDFDGVLHSYSSGWKGARNIPDPPVAGAIEWLRSMLDYPEQWSHFAERAHFDVCIFSSRSRYFGGRWAMRRWLLKHGLEHEYLEQIKFPLWKPPAMIAIDDRAITFQGTFPSVNELKLFQPWNKRKPEQPAKTGTET